MKYNLTWTPNSESTSQEVFRSNTQFTRNNPPAVPFAVLSGSDNSLEDNTILPWEKYWYSVASVRERFGFKEVSLANPIAVGYHDEIIPRISARPSWYSRPYAGVDFLQDGTTFSRSSPATRINSDGLIESVYADVIRQQYDIQTKGLLGWLIEGVFTNLATYSQQHDNAAWTKLNATITANAAIDPEGGMTADKLLDNAADRSHEVYQTHAVTSGVTYVWSTCLLAGEYEFGFCCMTMESLPTNQYLAVIDLTTGEVTTTNVVGTPTNTRYFVEELAKGFWRLTVRMTSPVTGNMLVHAGLSPSASPHLFNGRPRVVGDGTKGIYLWQSDFGEGWYPTSPVPTTATATARAVDLKETPFSAMKLPEDGNDFTICGEDVLAPGIGGTVQYVGSVSDHTLSKLLSIFRDTDGTFKSSGSGFGPTISGPVIVGAKRVRWAVRARVNGYVMAVAVEGTDLGSGVGVPVIYGSGTIGSVPTGTFYFTNANRYDGVRPMDGIAVRNWAYDIGLTTSDLIALLAFPGA